MKAHVSPEVVIRDGKPVAVIVEIEEYREMLERLEGIEDLAALQAVRREPLEFHRFEDYLAAQAGREGAARGIKPPSKGN
ncbi:MAG TPA: hypothetical protein VN783_05550 [Thermoanaerobaculia bacterium]|nr:hypothetical protein [Thermoanaerobaculia bacterium]